MISVSIGFMTLATTSPRVEGSLVLIIIDSIISKHTLEADCFQQANTTIQSKSVLINLWSFKSTVNTSSNSQRGGWKGDLIPQKWLLCYLYFP